MKLAFHQIVLVFTYMTMSYAYAYAADLLQNSGFESTPTNVTANATSQLLLLTRANSIPGWSFNGTLWYVTSGGNLSLPGNGHAVQLGENGRINQTFEGAGDVMDYVLTFTLAAQNENCVNNHTAVNVSTHERLRPYSDRSGVFFLERNFSRNLWESHAFYLGKWGESDSIDLEITSVISNSDHSVSCWPVVDTFTVTRKNLPRWYSGNILANGDLENGPTFLKNSSDGVLLNEEAERFESPLQEWAIMGTIKYIDSKHYKVPQGKAAIQLLSGDPSGIRIDLNLPLGSAYNLNFTIGDANDSCAGNFIVYLQVGNQIMNFTMQSNGTGSASNHNISFNSESSRETSIIFYSFNGIRRSDGVLCGPVLDNINIFPSYGSRIELYNGILMFCLCLALVILT